MSGPMTSGEIEDVLSSIRRLVTEDLRPAAKAPLPLRAEPEKLILTPALRVVSPAGAEAADGAPDLAKTVVAANPGPAPAADPEAAEAAPEAAPETAPETAPEAAPETSAETAAETAPPPAEAAADDVPRLLASIAAATDAAGGPAAEPWESETGDAWSAAPAAAADLLVFPRPAPASDPDEAVDDATAPAEPEPEVLDHAPAEPEVLGDAPAGASREAVEALSDAAWHMPEASFAPVDDAQVADEAPDPWAEEVLDDPIPAAQDDEVATDLHFARQSARAAQAGPAQVEEGFLLDDADDPYDSEALRDMVREIIREELQGTLGERITRNVRKLVRAEVNRALTARDFD